MSIYVKQRIELRLNLLKSINILFPQVIIKKLFNWLQGTEDEVYYNKLENGKYLDIHQHCFRFCLIGTIVCVIGRTTSERTINDKFWFKINEHDKKSISRLNIQFDFMSSYCFITLDEILITAGVLPPSLEFGVNFNQPINNSKSVYSSFIKQQLVLEPCSSEDRYFLKLILD